MVKALVVDDEIWIAKYTCRLLEKLEVEVVGYECNPVQALDKIDELKPDVVFLDIDMPKWNGLELAERAQKAGYDGETVFVTAYSEYAIEAFTVNALDYLLKPIALSDLKRAVERVKLRSSGKAALHLTKRVHSINVMLFGAALLYVGEAREPIRWMTAKSAEIFAFLLLQGRERGVSKAKLLEAVWPEKDEEKADINLRSTISRMNKTLREHTADVAIISTGNGYKLSLKDIALTVDAFTLESLTEPDTVINEENAHAFSAAVFSYREMLLEEMDRDWCRVFRSTYHTYFVSAAYRLVNYYEEMNAAPLIILKVVELILKYDPYDEKARGKALRLHYELKGRESAELYYKDYAQLLQKDLALAPGEHLHKQYSRLIKR